MCKILFKKLFTIAFHNVSGIGMDSSVVPLRHGGLSLVQTTDFFYPLVDDPYMMGEFLISVNIYLCSRSQVLPLLNWVSFGP